VDHNHSKMLANMEHKPDVVDSDTPL